MEFKAYETSSAQRRVYIIHQLARNSVFYNMPCAKIVEGNLVADHLEKGIKKLVQRHEILRTCFMVKNGKILQQVYDSSDFKLKYTTFPQVEINQLTQNFIQPFDLEKVPLWRAELVQLQSNKHLFLFDIHHIISDGVSINLIFNEIMVFYQGKTLPPLEFQYVDFTIWQNDIFNSGKIKHQEEYWLNVFFGEIPVLNMPTDFPRPLEMDTSGAFLAFEIGNKLTARLKTAAAKYKTTLYIVMLAAYNILLSKYTSQEDIIVGNPTAGRPKPELEKIVGMFVNTLAMRNTPVPLKTIEAFLEEVSANAISAFENQDYPFEMLVESLHIERHLNRNPLFDTMLVMQNFSQEIKVPGQDNERLKFIPYPIKERVAKFDLALSAVETGQKIIFELEYRTSLFMKETIQKLINHFTRIFQAVAENPQLKISKIQMITVEEKDHLLYTLNDTGADYPKDKTIHQIFEEQAERIPDNMAVIGEMQSLERNTEHHAPYAVRCALTYRELNEKSHQLAYRLTGKGLQPDAIVGIMAERSIEMVIGILGILKAGGAYLPIDPDSPGGRIRCMLKDSNVGVLLTTPELQVKIKAEVEGTTRQPVLPLQFIHIHTTSAFASQPSLSNLISTLTYQVSPAHLAYIIYTSGSTGKPKGVIVKHDSVVNLLFALHRRYPLRERDTYLLKTSYLFDVSVTELFGWFLESGRLVLLEPGREKDPGAILDMIAREWVTHINFVPSMFHAFVEIIAPREILKLASLKYIFLAGEALPPAAVNRFRSLNTSIAIENIYGPTEATVYASWYSLSGGDGEGAIPIGKPLPNVTLYILDKWNSLQPTGVVGELCIGGTGLARGYLNRPGLTAEKFDRDLWDSQDYHDGNHRSYRSYKSYTIYKTGDLARWLPDGNIEFLGRRDRQIKIRGFRIEPGEIECQLVKHEEIKEAVVVLKESFEENKNTAPINNKYLYAYIVAEREFNISQLREYLSKKLPAFMIPSHFVQIEKIPLTPGGKIDKKSLDSCGVKLSMGVDFAAPRNDLEKRIANSWKEVLKVDRVGIHESFFHLGGTSMDIIKLSEKFKEAFDEDDTVLQIFRYPTVSSFAQYLMQKKARNVIPGDAVELPVSLEKIKKHRKSQRNKRRGNKNVWSNEA